MEREKKGPLYWNILSTVGHFACKQQQKQLNLSVKFIREPFKALHSVRYIKPDLCLFFITTFIFFLVHVTVAIDQLLI